MEYAQLRPANDLAKAITQKVGAWIDQEQDEHHRKFCDISVVEEATDFGQETSDSDTTRDSTSVAEDIPQCHFVLSFHEEKLPLYPKLGYRVGKGHSDLHHDIKYNGVEILLAQPGSQGRKHLSAIHCFFRFNPSSGVLMIASETRLKPLEIFVQGSWKVIPYKDQYALYQQTTRIRFGGRLEYEFVYTVQDDRLLDFGADRDTWLNKVYSQGLVPETLWPLTALHNIRTLGHVLIYNTISTGAFGWVSKGLDPSTGDSIAVKELCIKTKPERIEALKELDVGMQVQDLPGLLPVLESWCEHGEARTCTKLPEKFYITMPLASKDFFQLSQEGFWTTTGYHVVLCLFRWPLLGIQELHKIGYMHRDITWKNMLVLSYDPPESVLCDYGKACHAKDDDNTALGPIPSLAPEVWKGMYTNTIDLWAWAIAVAMSFGYRFTKPAPITEPGLQKIHHFLQDLTVATPSMRHLINLLERILQLQPEKRPSVDEALQDVCWNPTEETTVHNPQVEISSGDESCGRKPKRGKPSLVSAEEQVKGASVVRHASQAPTTSEATQALSSRAYRAYERDPKQSG